jgi:activator of HSP90 ATPase
MKTKSLRQSIFFKTTPEKLYDALMSSKKHTKFTAARAVISSKIGGKFSTYDGYIHGTNLELIPNKKIRQLWRANESKWPKDYYSEVSFSFKKTKEGTRLDFSHKNIPLRYFEELKRGWYDAYWNPLKKMLE